MLGNFQVVCGGGESHFIRMRLPGRLAFVACRTLRRQPGRRLLTLRRTDPIWEIVSNWEPDWKPMSKPVVVSIPHRLGREEAARRIKSGFGRAHSQFAGILNISEQAWTGDRLTFRASALGQQAAGTIDVAEDHVLIEVTLPWLLARMAERLAPAIRREGVLMLEKK